MTINRLPPSRAADADLVSELTCLVNAAYAEAEIGLWLEGAARTDTDEMRRWVTAHQIVTAYDEGRLVGIVRTRRGDEGGGWFGVLSVDAAAAGRGLGRSLVAHVEAEAAGGGSQTMELEVLATAEGHPHLDRLRSWYERLGYQEVGRRALRDVSPAEAAFMVNTIDAVLMCKRLKRMLASPGRSV